MLVQARTLWAFLQRDIYVYRKRIRFYLSNYLILYPLNYIITFGYLAPKALMQTTEQADVLMITLLSGNLLLITLKMFSLMTSPMLYDFIGNRYIDFEIMRLKPKLVLLKTIVFNSIFAFMLLSPFFFICKLILRDNFNIPHVSWPTVLLITFLSCFCLASYVLMAMCIIKSPRQISSFWIRCNIPLFTLGGFWAPWFTMFQVSKPLGYAVMLNPFIYVTEGLRQALTGSELYFSVGTCSIALIFFSIVFYIGACYFFDKKMDPVN